MINPLVKTLTRAIINGTNEIFDVGTIKNKVAEGIGNLQKDLPELADNDKATYALSVAEEIARTGKENSTIFDETMDPEQKIATGVARFVNKTLEDLPDFRLSKEEEAIDIELDEDEQPLIDYFDALFKDYYGKNYTDEGRRRMATAVAKASKEIEGYEDYTNGQFGLSLNILTNSNQKISAATFGSFRDADELRPFNRLKENSNYIGWRAYFQKTINDSKNI